MRGDGLPGAGTSAGAASLEDFLSTLPALGSPATPASPEGPFLSFLVTTTGRTPEGLDETLLSLTAQSDTDFEVLVLADADAVDEVRALLAEHPPTLRERTVVVAASGSLADVVNAGLAEARGAYVTLADDLTWFGHWVETARAAVERSPGRCVRGIVLAQQVTTVHVGGSPGTRATSSPTGAGAAPFSLAQHVVRPLAPACGVAIPRTVITDLGVVLDASYGTAAVRRHLVRAVELAGVIDTGEVVALQRRHEDVADETDDDLALLVEAIDAHPWLSPARGRVRGDRRHGRGLRRARSCRAGTGPSHRAGGHEGHPHRQPRAHASRTGRGAPADAREARQAHRTGRAPAGKARPAGTAPRARRLR